MNTRLIKETRDLLPVLAGAVLITFLPYVIWGHAAANYAPVIFALTCAILASASFGGELQHRTLGLLLSQPVSRSVIWLEKMLVLGAAIVICTGVAWRTFGLFRPYVVTDPFARLYLTLIPLCAWCGVPWFTLETRSAIAGAVFGLVAPAGLVGLGVLAADKWLHFEQLGMGGQGIKLLVTGLLLAYCATTFVLGYLRFRRLELTDAESTDLALPGAIEAALAGTLSRTASKLGGPLGSLARKELGLQQTSFLIMAVFCLLAAIGAGVYFVRPAWGDIIIGGDFAVYVIMIPLVVGALAAAEERTLGIADWHFTLPPSAWRQWSVKIRVAFSISLLLGLLLPVSLYFGGRAMSGLFDVGLRGPPIGAGEWGILLEQGLIILLWQVCFTGVALYAGSFCNSTLRAILAGFVLIPVVVGWIWLVPGLAVAIGRAGLTNFVSVVLALVLLGFTQWFAWRNFRERHLPTRAIAGQLVRLGCYGIGFVFLLVCTVLVFKGQILDIHAPWPS